MNSESDSRNLSPESGDSFLFSYLNSERKLRRKKKEYSIIQILRYPFEILNSNRYIAARIICVNRREGEF